MVTREDFTGKITEFFQPVTDQITNELDGIKETETSLHTELMNELKSIQETEASLRTELGGLHVLYHEEFAGRLRSMQAELDHYHELDKGRAYEGILADIARIYDNYEDLPGELETALREVQNGMVPTPNRQICKDVHYLLSDLKDLIVQYGATPIRSEPGAMRDLQHTQIVRRIPTDDPARHLTIARSYNTGFRIDQRPIIKEQVDVYQYQRLAPAPETAAVATTIDVRPFHHGKASAPAPETAAVAANSVANAAEHDDMNKKEG